MRTTSIIQCPNATSYAMNFQGSPNCCISEFTNQCVFLKANWGKLFSEDTGDIVATFTKPLSIKG